MVHANSVSVPFRRVMRRRAMRACLWLLLSVTAGGLCLYAWQYLLAPDPWTDAELEQIRSLSLPMLPPLPTDPSNRVADDPRAQRFGHALFFDVRLSANGAIACATCHQPQQNFTDGLPRSQAIGQTKRNAQSIVGTAYSPWLYWDGRRDSQWAQALAPLEDPAEHGGNRMQFAKLIAQDAAYRAAYETLFGAMPGLENSRQFPDDARAVPVANAAWQAMREEDRQKINVIFANTGKVIAAYERLLQPGSSRFDHYAAAITADNQATNQQRQSPAGYSASEKRGLDVFLNAASCTQCHNGPLFTNNSFHNTGLLSIPGKVPDKGRIGALSPLFADPYNCQGSFNDRHFNAPGTAAPQGRSGSATQAAACPELDFVKTGKELVGAFRTPSLRNLAATAPYGHAGQFATLEDVLQHYNLAPDAMIGHNETKPLGLWPWQLQQLKAFLLSLQAPLAVEPHWLQPPPENYLTKYPASNH